MGGALSGYWKDQKRKKCVCVCAGGGRTRTAGDDVAYQGRSEKGCRGINC